MRRRDRFKPDLRDFVYLHRQHIRRQSVAVPGQCVDQCRAMFGIVEHHDTMLASGLTVGAEQYAQLAQHCIGRRQGITGGARGAGSGTLTATGADMRIDCDVIAGGRNGAGRAEIEAAAAADDLRARMRAQVFA